MGVRVFSIYSFATLGYLEDPKTSILSVSEFFFWVGIVVLL